jgi:hypothetical protein
MGDRSCNSGFRKVQPVESFSEISLWKLDMGMWDNMNHTLSNNYASIKQTLFISIGGTYREFAGVCVKS